MVQIGCLARFFNRYQDEVNFSLHHGFDFMQLWYDKNGIALHKDAFPHEEVIKRYGFPTIIHAVLDINEFDEHVPKIINILDYLEHKEVIIHPICESEEITDKTIYKLADKVAFALELFHNKGIVLYLENNSRLDPIFNTAAEISIMFEQNPKLELLLDIAHIDNYEHLEEIVLIKMPNILHIADKHFDAIHEHLPLGKGELDYSIIFNGILKSFSGKAIMEVIESDEAIINSKSIISNLL